MEILKNIKKGLLQGVGIVTILGLVGFSYAAVIGIATVTTGETLTADKFNEVVNKLNSIDSQLLGVGQTRQAMDLSNTSSPNYRVAGTTYTNNTGKPIVLSVTGAGQYSDKIHFYVDSLEIGSTDAGDYFDPSGNVPNNSMGTIIIPNLSDYKIIIDGIITLSNWSELR